MYVCTYAYVNIYMCVCICMRVYACTCIRAFVCMRILACKPMCVDVHVYSCIIYVCIWVCTCICTTRYGALVRGYICMILSCFSFFSLFLVVCCDVVCGDVYTYNPLRCHTYMPSHDLVSIARVCIMYVQHTHTDQGFLKPMCLCVCVFLFMSEHMYMCVRVCMCLCNCVWMYCVCMFDD